MDDGVVGKGGMGLKVCGTVVKIEESFAVSFLEIGFLYPIYLRV